MKHTPSWSYIGRRLVQAVLVMWAAFTVSFIVLYLLPGNPARVLLAGEGSLDPSAGEVAAVNHQYGFDRPFYSQYLHTLSGVVHGNLGSSYQLKEPVTTVLGNTFPSTLELASFSFVLIVVFGCLVGGATIYTRSRLLEKILDAVPAVGASLPTFWVGLILMELFSFRVHIFPSAGGSGFTALVLPGVSLAIPGAAMVAQVLARSLRESVKEPYVEVARAKGVGRLRVFIAHAGRNALLPVVTVLGMVYANLFAYSTIAETVFSRNGMGLALANAVQAKDLPVVEGIVLVIAGVYVVGTLIVDLIYPIIDPRVRIEKVSSNRPTPVQRAAA